MTFAPAMPGASYMLAPTSKEGIPPGAINSLLLPLQIALVQMCPTRGMLSRAR